MTGSPGLGLSALLHSRCVLYTVLKVGTRMWERVCDQQHRHIGRRNGFQTCHHRQSKTQVARLEPLLNTLDHVSSCFTFFPFFTTLVATQRRRCLLRSVWVNVMPDGCSLISGIGFRIELCCFYHPLAWPLCVVPCRLCFASFSVAILKMTHKMSSFVLCLRAGSDPTSSVLCGFVLVLLYFGVFCLFV